MRKIRSIKQGRYRVKFNQHNMSDEFEFKI